MGLQQKDLESASLDHLRELLGYAADDLAEIHKRFSDIYEAITKKVSHKETEGARARRDAVRFAMLSKQEDRARALVDRYVGEVGTNTSLAADLKTLLINF